jgi:hypothetical protein
MNRSQFRWAGRALVAFFFIISLALLCSKCYSVALVEFLVSMGVLIIFHYLDKWTYDLETKNYRNVQD